ncbi:TonB-dependent receptor family protein [Mucilaginibacter sp. BJC16-A38]|uniref:TonB-dependent receptor n=1 Tax=Mucilaginibacter phenanthrenivorans TaxID=1234842 RepID=UPI00215801B6|nr:TonB-dependent receptor [Mucilaginibacter phenanthrenivorans]MCR8560374.1 TonB-dependent receptor family protein [Mucilaginibacter phenanthrenivorans]
MAAKRVFEIFLLIVSIIFLDNFSVNGQVRHAVKGRVTDSLSGLPISLSTIALVNISDSSLYSYTVSGHQGDFSLDRLPPDKTYTLIVSAVGYISFKQILQSAKSAGIKSIEIRLKPATVNLKEVTISADRVPVVINKDTIEFAAEAFKTRPNAVVEELLKKLPGVQVYQDGSIYVNGKRVRRILINGKGFFGTDTRIASQNLNADLIDKIRITDDRENDPNNLLNDNNVEKEIDLKLKTRIRKSIFGKLHAAAGTNNRYDLGGILNIFRDTLQISLIGFSNNANQSSFSLGDLRNMGGFERSGVSSFHVNQNDQITGINGISFGGEGQGIQTISSGGININNDYGPDLSVNIQDFFTRLHNVNNITNVRQQFLGDTTLNTRSYNETFQDETSNTLSGKLKWLPGKMSSFEYTPQLNMNSTNNNSSLHQLTDVNQSLLNQVENTQTGTTSHLAYSHILFFNQKFKKEGEALTISQNTSFGPGKDAFQSRSFSYPSAVTDSSTEIRNQKTYAAGIDLSIAYRRPMGKHFTVILGTTNSFNHRAISVNTPMSSQLYDILLDPAGNTAFSRNDWINKMTEGLKISITKRTSFEATLGEQIQSLANSPKYQHEQHYFDLLPSLKFNSGTFGFKYSVNVNQPNINDLQPVPNLIVPLYVFTGNPYLKPSYDQNIYTSYFKYYAAKQLVFNIYVNADFIRNDVISTVQVDSNGVQKIGTTNRNGTVKAVLGSSLSKNFQKINDIEIKANATVYLGYQSNPIIVNGHSGSNQQYTTTFIQRIDINWKDIIQLIPEYRVTGTTNSYSHLNYSRVDFLTHRLNTQLTVTFSKSLTLGCNYTFLRNPDVSDELHKTTSLFNSDVTYRFMKENRCELKLAVFDLFNQNINFDRIVSQNYILDSQTVVLKRYISLGVVYNIKKIYKR